MSFIVHVGGEHCVNPELGHQQCRNSRTVGQVWRQSLHWQQRNSSIGYVSLITFAEQKGRTAWEVGDAWIVAAIRSGQSFSIFTSRIDVLRILAAKIIQQRAKVTKEVM